MIWMRAVIQFAVVLALVFAKAFAGSPLECTVSGSGKSFAVTVNVRSPHPGEMVVRTPDGRTIWLQADHIPFTFPAADNFEKLSEFVLDRHTLGSWFDDWGELESVAIFSVEGDYELIIGEDIESGRQSASSLSCIFSVSNDDSADKN